MKKIELTPKNDEPIHSQEWFGALSRLYKRVGQLREYDGIRKKELLSRDPNKKVTSAEQALRSFMGPPSCNND